MPEDKLSFIPKKAGAPPVYRGKGPGFFLAFSFLLLVVSSFALGGMFFYKKSLAGEVDLLMQTLDKTKSAFEPALINTIIQFADRIDSAKTLLGDHKTLLPFFEFLEKSTLPDVRFKEFTYSFSEAESKNGEILIVMGGVAKSYAALASQAEIFEKEKSVKSVYFSDFKLGDNGAVNFRVKISSDPLIFKYKAQ